MSSLRVGALPAFIVLYAMMYGGFGVASPFWPRFFEARGLGPQELGLLLGLGTLMRLAAGPVAGRVADLTGELRAVLAACAALAAAAALGLLAADGFWLLLAIHLGQSAALAPTTTLADALALNAATPRGPRRGFEYGWVRGAASAAFIVGTLAAGQIIGSATGLSAVVWIHAGLLMAAVVAVAWVPALEHGSPPDPGTHTSVLGGLRALWRIAPFRRVVLIAALIYGSHAMYDTFAVIRWYAAGLDAATTSLLWSEAVAAEVLVFFLIGPALVRRLGPHGAATAAAVAGMIRWVVMGLTSEAAVLALVQPLHGFTFALLHLACMRLIALVVPVDLAATAQALYAFAAGFATAVLMVVSGDVYGRLGGETFLIMALLCAAALPVALTLRPCGAPEPKSVATRAER